MDKKRLLELAGLTENEKRYAVLVKHQGESAVAITPHKGVDKTRAMEVKKVLMGLKKDGMKGGKSSDFASVIVKEIQPRKVTENLAGMQLNEAEGSILPKESQEFRELLNQNKVSDARKFAKNAGWSVEIIKAQVHAWFIYGK